MKNIAMRLMYDGTAYHGWQYQNNAVTVQQTIEDALEKLLKKPTKVTGCSRTDSGVHALDYVMNFHTDTGIPTEKLPYALNYLLNRDIAATEAWEVPENFNARFSSKGKRYEYKIWNSKMCRTALIWTQCAVPQNISRASTIFRRLWHRAAAKKQPCGQFASVGLNRMKI